MKTLYISVSALFFSANLSAQTVNQQELNQFYEKQQTPFLESNAEIFVLDNTAWQRPYGEREFMLTPLMGDVNAYYSRIKSLDNPIDSTYKSRFSFVRVDVNNQSKLLLQNMNINVPTYIQNEVILYLPQIDIDHLIQEGVNFMYLPNYGKQEPLKLNIKQNKAVMYFEGFEVNSVPGSNFLTTAVGSNCGWKDVGCVAKTGNFSVWCAGSGSACNSICSNSSYVNNMFSSFVNFPAINTTGFTNMIFSFWMNFTLESISQTDYLDFEFDLGSGFQLGATYNHQSSGHGTNNYVQRAFTINGLPNILGIILEWLQTGVLVLKVFIWMIYY